MAGYRSPLCWLGISAPGVEQGGVRSLLAPWTGGACRPGEEQAGVRSLLAPWVGGAGTNPIVQGGMRSLLAPWAGGVCRGPAGPEPSGVPNYFWADGSLPRPVHAVARGDADFMDLLTLISLSDTL